MERRSDVVVQKWRRKGLGGGEDVGVADVSIKLIYCSTDEKRHARRKWVLAKTLLQQYKKKQQRSLLLYSCRDLRKGWSTHGLHVTLTIGPRL